MRLAKPEKHGERISRDATERQARHAQREQEYRAKGYCTRLGSAAVCTYCGAIIQGDYLDTHATVCPGRAMA